MVGRSRLGVDGGDPEDGTEGGVRGDGEDCGAAVGGEHLLDVVGCA